MEIKAGWQTGNLDKDVWAALWLPGQNISMLVFPIVVCSLSVSILAVGNGKYL